MTLLSDMARAAPGRRRRDTPQFRGHVTDLIVTASHGPCPRPQAFLVEQDPNWTLPTHFHQEHQFQVVVGGGGSLGRTRLGLLDVHYASPHSAYGPLISGDQGLAYLTLRAVSDNGAWYLPDRRESLLVRLPKRHAHGGPDDAMRQPSRAGLPARSVQALLQADGSGLASWMLRMAPGETMAAPLSQVDHGGRFLVVAEGSLSIENDGVDGLGVIWSPADATSSELQAGPDGATLVIVQFPAVARQSFIEAMNLPVVP